MHFPNENIFLKSPTEFDININIITIYWCESIHNIYIIQTFNESILPEECSIEFNPINVTIKYEE